MAYLNLQHIAITGISASVPKQAEEIKKVYTRWGGGEILNISTPQQE